MTRAAASTRLHPRAGRARPAQRPGAAALGMIIMMIIAQLVIISVVVAGARDNDSRVLRNDTTKAQYAADAVTQMALRETYTATDADGDGTIGSIAGGVAANGPAFNGARAAVSASTVGRVTTFSVRGASGACIRASMVDIKTLPCAVTPIATYATNAAPTVPAVTMHSAGAWSAPVSTTAATDSVCWQIVRNSPPAVAAPTRALVTLAADRSLWLSFYSSGAWGAASSLTTDTGTPNTPVFAADYESKSGQLVVAYRKGTSNSIYFRKYSSASPAEQSFSLSLLTPPTWMRMVGKPGSNELLLLVAAGSRLYGVIWDGSAWNNSSTLETSLPTTGRPFDVTYLSQSGAAMVVWTATTGVPRYALWSGAAWGSAATLPSIAGGVPAGWVRVVSSPSKGSNEALVAIIGTNQQINVNRWSGSAWGSNTVVEATAAASTEPRVDLCYQPDGAQALLVWHRSGQTALRYRTWNGSAWSAETVGPDMTTASETIRLVRGYGDTEIMMLVRREGPFAWDGYNVYSQYGTVTTGSTLITGLVGSGGGYSLPPPPAGTPGATNLTPANGSVVAPGAYGALNILNNDTIGFTTGTYIFSTVSLGNSTTMNFNTSAGPIIFIVASGDLTGNNSNAFINTGNAGVQLNILNGNVSFSNSTSFGNFDLIIYNGTASFQNNTMGAVNIWASGNIDFKNNGTVSVNGLSYAGTPPALSSVLWTGGVPGSLANLTTSMAPAGVCDPCSLAGSPLPSQTSLESWAAVAP